jgi:hypothetical protein
MAGRVEASPQQKWVTSVVSKQELSCELSSPTLQALAEKSSLRGECSSFPAAA